MKISTRHLGGAFLAVTLTIGVTQATTAAYASETPPHSAQETIHVLQSGGLVDPPNAVGVAPTNSRLESGVITPKSGLTVHSRNGTVRITPVTDSIPKHFTDSNSLVYTEGRSFDYALTTTVSGVSNAGYAVLKDSKAPESYRFRVTVDGHPAQLTQSEGGVILVQNRAGVTVNIIGAAWARDAAGKELESSYSIMGNVLTQHVNHRGAKYPVIADPALECDWVFCTVLYSKSETKTLASSMSAAAALLTAACSALAGPIGGVACGVSAAYAIDYANNALNNGKCVGVRAFIYLPSPTTHLVQEKCRS